MISKPVIIFVPGGWHTPSCFSPTTHLLTQAGYTTHGVPLPTVGSELRGDKPPLSWDDDVAAVRSAVFKHLDAGHNVVLVGHSSGGIIAAEASRGLDANQRRKEGKESAVVQLVFLAALLLEVGANLWDLATKRLVENGLVRVEGELCFASIEEDLFYNECSPETSAELLGKLQSFPWKVTQAPTTYAAWRDIPSGYLLCEKDRAIALAVQQGMLEKAGIEYFKVEQCDADHSPFQSRPEQTAKFIRRLAGDDLDE